MSRIASFLLGLVIGAGSFYGALNFHFVRAEDGLHIVPKMASGLNETYVDIRRYALADWNDHISLAAAIVRADKTVLMKEAATDSLRSSLDAAIQTLSGS